MTAGCQPCFDPSQSILTGMTRFQLQQALNCAQQAYIELMTGEKGVKFSYTQGDGTKSVEYVVTDQGKLTAFIQLLQAQLGIRCRTRRPINFSFGR